MNIIIASKKRKIENISKDHPAYEIIDVTSKGALPFLKFSPFYPHKDIPVPFSDHLFATSVEGIWQGLKVFERSGVDVSKFNVLNMKNIKRTVRKFGSVLGHKNGINGDRLLSYQDARWAIYLPSYKWILDHKLQNELKQIEKTAAEKGVVLLDYETNEDICNLKSPLSHASLIKKYILKEWPVR
jgi:hypothetical protein